MTNRKGSCCGKYCKSRGLSARHAQDLLNAFRQDATKLRYKDWDDLIDYCSLLRDAGRSLRARRPWRGNGHLACVSDALCAALQIINHLQDCGVDYRTTRPGLYPACMCSGHRELRVEVLGYDKASPALRACLDALITRTSALLGDRIMVLRLMLSTRVSAVKSRLFNRWRHVYCDVLRERDPLSARVHLTKGRGCY